MSAFAAVRARAWNSGDARPLSQLDAPASSALRSDLDLLASVTRAGQRYRGVKFTVASARPISGGVSTARVLARLDTSAYDIVGADGSVERRAAEVGQPLVFDLVWTAGGWRIASVSAPPAPS